MAETRKVQHGIHNVLSIDVEGWFHVLNAPAAPKPETWASLDDRVQRSMEQILHLLGIHGIRATLFWLGWVAERHKQLLRRCCEAGHEIASHGYYHVLPEQAGRKNFRDDIQRARKTLEDVTGTRVDGFRVAGFEIDHVTRWVFDVIRESGYRYDSSVFPSRPGLACEHRQRTGPYLIRTESGVLMEVPLVPVDILGCKLFVFGGGYLRLAPRRLIEWGVKRLHRRGSPLIVYLHPREIDPEQPRMRLGVMAGFRYYVNIRTTMPKLKWMCQSYRFIPMRELAMTCLGEEGQALGGESGANWQMSPECDDPG